METEMLKILLKNHDLWLRSEGQKGKRINLESANLGSANLMYANLDFSCLPLWCGSMKMIVDVKIARQIAAHLYALDVRNKDKSKNNEFQKIRTAIYNFAKKSHRAADLEI